MAKIEFTPSKLSFDSAGCMNAIMRIADAYMSTISERLIEIIKKYIDIGGNGSTSMKNAAKSVVNEILHEVTMDHINIEAGFNEADAAGMAEDFFVAAMVVVYGNQDSGPIVTKPGSATWKKDVTNYSENVYSKTSYPIPQFDQFDKSGVIRDNAIKEIKVYFEKMIEVLDSALDSSFFAQFLTGG